MPLDRVVENLRNALNLLKKERERVEAQLRTVEQLVASGAVPEKRGRGRPRKNPFNLASLAAAGESAAREDAATKRKKAWTPEAREAARDRMKKYWAERKAGNGGGGKK